MKFPYNEKVLEHFRHPRNVGKIEDADGKAMEGSPACGDMVSVQIKVNEKTKRIQDIKFESYGCGTVTGMKLKSCSIIVNSIPMKSKSRGRSTTSKNILQRLRCWRPGKLFKYN